MSVAATAIRAACIGCGCDDFHACDGGCFWLRVDYAESLGVCSRCPEFEAQWDDGDHTPHAQPIAELEDPVLSRVPRPEQARPAQPRRRLPPEQLCEHDWPFEDVQDADQCRWCGMGFLRHIFTEMP